MQIFTEYDTVKYRKDLLNNSWEKHKHNHNCIAEVLNQLKIYVDLLKL